MRSVQNLRAVGGEDRMFSRLGNSCLACVAGSDDEMPRLRIHGGGGVAQQCIELLDLFGRNPAAWIVALQV